MSAMISNNMAMAADAGANVASQDVQNKLTALGGSKNLSPEAKAKKLREACEGFESIFIQKMWQEMRKTVPQDGLMHGKEEKFWQDMYDQELAKKMTSAGGIGLADMMYEQLSRNLVSASRGTASAMAQQRAFVPEAAPMFSDAPAAETAVAGAESKPQTLAPSSKASKPAMNAANIYDGVAPVQDHGPMEASAPAKESQSAPVAQAAQTPDPLLDNAAVSQALASLRQEQHRRQQDGTAPSVQAQAASAAQGVTPEQAFAAAQPVHHNMSPIERAQMVRRDIGDKLGARGVRNPIKPQTAKAQARTEQARARREGRQNYASLTPENAQGQAAPQAANTMPQSQPGQGLQRSNTVETTPRNSRAGAGIAAYHEQQRQLGQAPSPAAAQSIAPLTAGKVQAAEASAEQVKGIPPLTAGDMRI